jgi:uncharacterized repeat protein (TIGR03803 family)
MRHNFFAGEGTNRRRSAVWALVAIAACATASIETASSSSASGLKTIYSFCKESGCPDGSMPQTLMQDSSGNLYGTTDSGGIGGGTVFELVRKSDNRFKFQLIHAFCPNPCTDGSYPSGGLIIDVHGNLYGTTIIGGPGGSGTVYKLTRKGAQWQLATLLAFNHTNGGEPLGRLSYQGAETGAPYDGTSALYGTTYEGGEHDGGTVFELKRKKGIYAQTVLYDFCSAASCADGSAPSHDVYVDGAGNVFGPTQNGGGANEGVIFELSRTHGNYQETVLYSFCQLASCADGAPPGPITVDASGNLVGTTYSGGVTNNGTVFSLKPNGSGSQETVLYNFCSQLSCSDGATPLGAVSIDQNGNLFGVAASGTEFGTGGLFKLTGTTESVLYSFCALPNCTDGAAVEGGVVIDSAGNLFGVTGFGGAYNNGTVFRFTP